jgi:hypothetical protein
LSGGSGNIGVEPMIVTGSGFNGLGGYHVLSPVPDRGAS